MHLTRIHLTAWRATALAWLAACVLALAPTVSQLHAAYSADLLPDQVLCSAAGVRTGSPVSSPLRQALSLLTGACPLCALQSHLPTWPIALPQLTMQSVVGALALFTSTKPEQASGLPPATGPPATFRC